MKSCFVYEKWNLFVLFIYYLFVFLFISLFIYYLFVFCNYYLLVLCAYEEKYEILMLFIMIHTKYKPIKHMR
jgi:hypothetical protein